MIRYTCEVEASLIQLGVLYDRSLDHRIINEKLQLIYELRHSGRTQQFKVGYVTDIYIAKGALQVDVELRPSISFFFFKKPTDIRLQPVLIGCGSDWRLLRFDVVGE